MRNYLAFACGCLFLLLAGVAIYQKEQLLAHGQPVLLALAPVDPRSLMQGDYMALNFELANAIGSELLKQEKDTQSELSNHDGFAILRVNAQGVGEFVRLETGNHHAQPTLATDELRLRYRWRNYRVKLATDAFFFQEGQGEHYAQAKYGHFRVNPQGEALLSDLYDGERRSLRQTH